MALWHNATLFCESWQNHGDRVLERDLSEDLQLLNSLNLTIGTNKQVIWLYKLHDRGSECLDRVPRVHDR